MNYHDIQMQSLKDPFLYMFFKIKKKQPFYFLAIPEACLADSCFRKVGKNVLRCADQPNSSLSTRLLKPFLFVIIVSLLIVVNINGSCLPSHL